MAADSVGPNQLISTGVTAADTTSATITVDADGRITAAASGSAGASNFEYVLFSLSGSGNVTAPASVSKVQAFLWGAGGGGGGGDNNPPESGRAGASGGFGYWTDTLAGPSSVPYSIGSGGNGGSHPNGLGNAGGATNFYNFTANGGGGSSRNATGTPGTQPGSTGVGNATSFWNDPRGTGGNGAPGASGSPGGAGRGGAAIALFNQG
jgi:hypothetical protein